MASNSRGKSLSGLEEQQDLDIRKREKHSKQKEQTEGRHRGMLQPFRSVRFVWGRRCIRGNRVRC